MLSWLEFCRLPAEKRHEAFRRAEAVKDMVNSMGWTHVVKPELETCRAQFMERLIVENNPRAVAMLQANIRAIAGLLKYIEVEAVKGAKLAEYAAQERANTSERVCL